MDPPPVQHSGTVILSPTIQGDVPIHVTYLHSHVWRQSHLLTVWSLLWKK